jgi:hypothetical protein
VKKVHVDRLVVVDPEQTRFGMPWNEWNGIGPVFICTEWNNLEFGMLEICNLTASRGSILPYVFPYDCGPYHMGPIGGRKTSQ